MTITRERYDDIQHNLNQVERALAGNDGSPKLAILRLKLGVELLLRAVGIDSPTGGGDPAKPDNLPPATMAAVIKEVVETGQRGYTVMNMGPPHQVSVRFSKQDHAHRYTVALADLSEVYNQLAGAEDNPPPAPDLSHKPNVVNMSGGNKQAAPTRADAMKYTIEEQADGSYLLLRYKDPIHYRPSPSNAELEFWLCLQEAWAEIDRLKAAQGGKLEFTEEHVQHVLTSGPGCTRQACGAQSGVCPRTALPCYHAAAAVRHVLEAVAYGVNKGRTPYPRS